MTDTTTPIKRRTDGVNLHVGMFQVEPDHIEIQESGAMIVGNAAAQLHPAGADTIERLTTMADIGRSIFDQATTHLGSAPRVALHFPIGNLEALDEGRTDGWADMISAPGFDVHISCDGDCFEEWGRPHDITNRTESLHLVATCVATFAEVARVAAFVGSVALVDGDPVATDPADWAQPAALTPKAA